MPTHESHVDDVHELEREYELLRELGGSERIGLHLARRRSTGRLVVIEIAVPRGEVDRGELGRMESAARELVGVEHANLVPIEDVVALPSGAVAVVREYVEGRSLAEVVRGEGELPVAMVERVLTEVLHGLAALHARGYVHRDVRPEQIFLDAERDRAVLAGLASARPTGSDTALGAWESSTRPPYYLSPEGVEGRPIEARSDVYGAGLVAWTMLTGRRPWSGESVYAVAAKQTHEELPRIATLREDVPGALETVVERALRKAPDARWPSVRAMLDAMGDGLDARAARAASAAGVAAPVTTTAAEEPLVAERPIARTTSRAAVTSPPVGSRGRRTPRRSPRGGLIAVALLLLIAAGTFYVVFGGRRGARMASAGEVASDSITVRTLPRSGDEPSIPAPPADPSALGTTAQPAPMTTPYPATATMPQIPPTPRTTSDSATVDDGAAMERARARLDSIEAARAESASSAAARERAQRDSLTRARTDSMTRARSDSARARSDSIVRARSDSAFRARSDSATRARADSAAARRRRDSTPPDTTSRARPDTSATVRPDTSEVS